MEEKKNRTKYRIIRFDPDLETYIKSHSPQDQQEIEDFFTAAIDGREGVERYYRRKREREVAEQASNVKETIEIYEEPKLDILMENPNQLVDIEPLTINQVKPKEEYDFRDLLNPTFDLVKEVYNEDPEFISRYYKTFDEETKQGKDVNVSELLKRLNATDDQRALLYNFLSVIRHYRQMKEDRNNLKKSK